MDQSLNQTIRSTVEPGIGSGTDNDNNIYRISHRTRDKHIYITKVKIKAYKRMKQLDPVISMKYIKNDGEQSWNMQKAMEKRQGTPLCFGEMKRKYRGRQRLPSTVPIQVEKNQVIKIFGVFGLKNIKSIMCYWYWLYIYSIVASSVSNIIDIISLF